MVSWQRRRDDFHRHVICAVICEQQKSCDMRLIVWPRLCGSPGIRENSGAGGFPDDCLIKERVVKRNLMAAIIAAISIGATSHAVAQQVEGYAQLGFGSISGVSDSGLGVKLGADFAKDLFGVKNLGATGWFMRFNTEETGCFGCSKWEWTYQGFGGGITYSTPPAAVIFQGRLIAGINKLDLSGCAGGCSGSSGNEFRIGLGLGAAVPLNKQMSVRIDWDAPASDISMLSAGIGYKF